MPYHNGASIERLIVAPLLPPILRGTSRVGVAALVLPLLAFAQDRCLGQMILKTEHFDVDPAWDGHNNRATTPPPAQIIQNFGFRSTGTRAGGPAGEAGGTITPAGEPAYYAKSIPIETFNDTLFASGTLNIPEAGHTLLGFFNSATINEWRTPNTISLRLYGRETHFEAFADYGTSKWRAGGNAFPVTFATGSAVHTWSLAYDPAGNGGGGSVTATIDGQTRVTNLDPGHKLDGATFDRFGLLNVIKSYDNPGQFWIDNVNINGVTESFTSNPGWVGLNNVRGYTSTNVRPRFDFGYSPSTRHAGGANPGEIGGHTFRGDNRFAERMAYYGDELEQTLTMSDPLHASGKVTFRRGVSDSTTLIGFFHSADSVRVSTSQAAHAPENFIGVAIEGPSAEGFLFYASYGTDAEGVAPRERGVNPPYIYPDGTPHDWSLDYDPAANEGLGRITLNLDGQLTTLDLEADHRAIGAHFDRFGMITTHVDGNGQTVYFDDLTYTIAVPEPSVAWMMLGAAALRARVRNPRKAR